MFLTKQAMLVRFFAAVLAVFVAVVPAPGQTQGFGGQGDFWREMCFVERPNTNALAKIDLAIELLGRISEVALQLVTISNVNFALPDITRCAPNLTIPSLNIPGIDAFLNCFNLFQPTDYNALLNNTLNCVDGALNQYTNLGNLVNAGNVDFGNLYTCLLPNYTIPTITLGDGLLEIVGLLQQAFQAITEIRGSLGRLKFTADFVAHICDTQIIQANTQGLEASGASFGANSSQSGQNLNLDFQFNPGAIGPGASAAQSGGPAVAAATVTEVYGVTAFVTGSGKIKGKKKSAKKSYKLKRGAGNAFKAKINLAKLGCPGNFKIAYVVETSSGGMAVPGAAVKVTSCR